MDPKDKKVNFEGKTRETPDSPGKKVVSPVRPMYRKILTRYEETA